LKFFNINVKKVISLLFILGLTSLPTYLAYLDNKFAALISLITFALALAFLNLDKFSKFKGGGFEAELKQAVNETYIAIDELKKVALNISGPTVSLLAVRGMMQYLPLQYKLEYAEKISKTLTELNVDKKDISEVLSVLYERVEKDHIRRLLCSINSNLGDENKIFDAFDQLDLNIWPISTICSFAKDHSINITEELDDYNFFIENRSLRRPDEWQG